MFEEALAQQILMRMGSVMILMNALVFMTIVTFVMEMVLRLVLVIAMVTY